ncbi:hypothetical protein BJV82DRAFT_604272 [Fennellomyces sp. T-0311]|nr:hypothetical protein BJV82DRAFT_604272 [Fennellomyces sp. T-0311]
MMASTGDYSTMEQHDTLINLSLTSNLITGEDIKPMLQRCQRLRRLVMDKCSPTVFDPINKYAPNLEILSYNNLDVPDLSSSAAGQPQGLRNIYTNNGGTSVPTKDIFPLIYKNMATLKTAYLNISALSQQEVQQLSTVYPDFKLWNLESLTFWTKNQTELFIIQALRGVTTLSFLSLLNVKNLNAIVTVIKNMPPVRELRIEHTHGTTNNLGLVELFRNYSTHDQKQRALSIAYFRKSTVITDSVLNSLADVTTLRSITLKSLDYITTEGIRNFLEKTAGQLTYLKLCDMEVVTNECIMMISCAKPSTEVYLENLPSIKNQGILAMVNNKGPQFKRLTIKNCKSTTKDCVQYAKKNVKIVTYE